MGLGGRGAEGRGLIYGTEELGSRKTNTRNFQVVIPRQKAFLNTKLWRSATKKEDIVILFVSTLYSNFDSKTVSSKFIIKGTATDVRYFARSKFSRSLVHKKNFTLI